MTINDNPGTANCHDYGHTWRVDNTVDEDCDCGNAECWVVCEDCGAEARTCEET